MLFHLFIQVFLNYLDRDGQNHILLIYFFLLRAKTIKILEIRKKKKYELKKIPEIFSNN